MVAGSLYLSSVSMPSVKLVALVALAVQTSLQMLTMRYSRLPSQPVYIASTAVVTAEACKIVASTVLLCVEHGGERAVHLLWRDVFQDWRGVSSVEGGPRFTLT